VYSAGYFDKPEWSLEEAQREKLDRICQELRLAPGERFLDVGCGWGALLIHAAERYGVHAEGCTLSHEQYDYATSLIRSRGLENRVSVYETDYREITGRFDKIASVGMFEHVGRRRLAAYFRKIHGLLADGGLFFNSGICRPEQAESDSETWFLLQHVFPGGELAHLSKVVREVERAGFCIQTIRSFRKNYARTCREWVERLRGNRDRCIALVGDCKYRTWLLYLAASALSFENCASEAFSILMQKS
jgi:cyclopropane-fatty-acyl-phospholipid synthase